MTDTPKVAETPEAHEIPLDTLAPARVARLSRGLLMTLRTLSSQASDDWNGMSTSKKLAIQRFYKAFEVWIRELEALSEPDTKAERVKTSNTTDTARPDAS